MFPQPDKKIIVTAGKKAYQGTLSYTKNIDLTEDGYIKLAAPLCRVYSSEETSDFNLPYDIFNRTEGTYKILTPGSDSYELNLSSLGVVIDSSFPGGSDGLRVFPWVSNNWFFNSGSAVYDYTGASESGVYTSRIAENLDFIELFISANTLVGRDADNVNILKQYNTSFADTPDDLNLPANYAITGAAYSNEMMGVTTKQRKNQGNAIFAVWDGTTTAANAIYPVNDPYILDIVGYKNSWVILTSQGQLLYFNGGGFDEIGRLPNFDLQNRLVDFTPTTSIVFGKLMHADGDRIYVNCASLPETSRSRKPYSPFYSGGAYCFDPKHGFYHYSAPSYSQYDSESITFASNIGTTASEHYMETGDEVLCPTTSNELTAGKIYFAIKLTATTFSLANSYEEAIAGTVKTITNGAYSLFYVKRYDYGIEILKLRDCGLIRNEKDFSGYTTSGVLPFFLGASIHPNNLGTTRVNLINVAAPLMNNRGYFVMGKWQTPNLQEMYQGVAVKYRQLKAQDKIIVKAKTKDTNPMIVGDLTLFDTAAYAGEGVIWDGSGQYFATSADLTGVEEGDEVHIYAGPGAGQSAHITEINGNVTDGWEVLLDEKIRGTVSGRKSCVSIDKFKKLGVITSDDTEGVKRLALGNPGASMEIKVELRGIETAVSEIIPISSAHTPAV
jgi:hypothetical protein